MTVKAVSIRLALLTALAATSPVPARAAMPSLGDGMAAYQTGDYVQAYGIVHPHAREGDAEAQHMLGILYEYGRGVERDNAEAARWHTLAAEQGHAGAQTTLGTLYMFGDGVAQDYAEAARWYALAAGQGEVDAQFSLGLFYREGWGVGQDLFQAARLLGLAAEQGNTSARTALDSLNARGGN